MTISVALCTYNGDKHLREQLDSILSQQLPVDEIIVCDDRSTDQTWCILKNYQQENPDIFQIFQNEKSLGSNKNFEKCIQKCTKTLLFLSDQDDVWQVDKTQKISVIFKENLKIKAVCTNGFLIDDRSQRLEEYFPKWDVIGEFLIKNPATDLFNFITTKGNIATGATMAIKTDFYRMAIPFPMLKNFHHDEWIALLASAENALFFLNEKLTKYRIHNQQQVGGIAFHVNSGLFESILNYFNLNAQNNDFKSLKSRLRSQIEWHNKFLIHFKTNPKYAILNTRFLREMNKTQKMMEKKYPIRSFLLKTMDRLTNKRQLLP